MGVSSSFFEDNMWLVCHRNELLCLDSVLWGVANHWWHLQHSITSLNGPLSFMLRNKRWIWMLFERDWVLLLSLSTFKLLCTSAFPILRHLSVWRWCSDSWWTSGFHSCSYRSFRTHTEESSTGLLLWLTVSTCWERSYRWCLPFILAVMHHDLLVSN